MPIPELLVQYKDFIVYRDASYLDLGYVPIHDKNVIAFASGHWKVC